MSVAFGGLSCTTFAKSADAQIDQSVRIFILHERCAKVNE